MKSTLPQLLQLVLFVFVIISCSPEDDSIFMNSKIDAKIQHSQLELNVLKLVNEHRALIGKNNLQKLDVISSVASTHTNYMAKIKEVNHDNFPTRHSALVNNAQAKSVGENVAFGYNSAEGVLKAWLKSPEHKKILENDAFTHFGIATESDNEGRLYFTQIFIKK